MTIKRRKVSIIGSGFTGATTAFLIAKEELANVVLVDIPEMEEPTKGKALDMLQASPVLGFDSTIEGTTDYSRIVDSDIVIITAGVARKPGMSRDDLVHTNAKIMEIVAKNIKKYAKNSIVIILTNPVDAMTYSIFKQLDFPKNRIIGQSGILDTARFCTFIAQELNISVKDVTSFVLGGHGDEMVPLIRYTSVGGIPVEHFISNERLEEIVERTRTGGGEIVELLGKGSAYYAPAASLTQMAKSILKDERRILPTVAYLEGEYGYNNIFFGVPTVLGKNGIEKIIELNLTTDELKVLDQSVQSVKKLLEKL